MKQDTRFKLIVNGMIVAISHNLSWLKAKGAKQKALTADYMVSIEDCEGWTIHHFFGD